MVRRTLKGDVSWNIPGQKTPIAYSTKATSDLIAVLAEQGGTFREVQSQINYGQKAKTVLQAYIDQSYGDVEACKCFKYCSKMERRVKPC